MLHLINSIAANQGKNQLVGLELVNPVYYEFKNLDNTINYKFVVNLIYVLDEVLLQGDSRLCTMEQRDFFVRYVSQADMGLLDEDLKQFDAYLANWFGETNENYVKKINPAGGIYDDSIVHTERESTS